MKYKIITIILLLRFIINAEPLKVVTINVWSGLDYIGNFKMGEYESKAVREQRYHILVNQLKQLDPDIIALNEANQLPHYARRIAKDLGYDQVHHLGVAGIHFGPIGLPINLREGDVILAKKSLKLKSAGRKQLSGGYVGKFLTFHFTDATQVVGATIELNDQIIFIFNTHWHASQFANQEMLTKFTTQYLDGELTGNEYLHLINDAVTGKEWRLNEARKMVAFINRTAGDNPVILMGDFNDLSNSEPIGVVLAAGFADSYSAVNSDQPAPDHTGELAGPGYTWDELLNANIQTYYLTSLLPTIREGRQEEKPTANARRDRIDYIFLRGNELKISASKVVLNQLENDLHPSDHFGVMTLFEVPNH
jgi:endonuclease/exonuclease/phosphatase family metal-dependent hydrolase